MPLARIITKVAEDSLELTMQLRARGFKVETVAPGEVSATPADLEVHLDECDSDRALSAAANAQSDEDLYVFVAPGALDEQTRPMCVIPLVPQSEESEIFSHPGRGPAAVLPFVAPEDDPILAEFESDLILAELEPACGRSDAPALTREKVASVCEPLEHAVEMPAESSPRSAKRPVARDSVTETQPSSNALVSAKHGDSWIPKVPERPQVALSVSVPESPRTPRPVVKVSFRTGPRFWRTVWASLALLFLAGTLALVVGMRPQLPRDAVRVVTKQSQLAAEATRATPALPALGSSSPTQFSARSTVAAADVVTQAAQLSKAKAPRRARRARSSRADEMIAEDTVIFYDRSHGSSAAKALSRGQSRKYTNQN